MRAAAAVPEADRTDLFLQLDTANGISSSLSASYQRRFSVAVRLWTVK
jgi:hypothetical protein